MLEEQDHTTNKNFVFGNETLIAVGCITGFYGDDYDNSYPDRDGDRRNSFYRRFEELPENPTYCQNYSPWESEDEEESENDSDNYDSDYS